MTFALSFVGVVLLAYAAGIAIGTVIHERYQARLP